MLGLACRTLQEHWALICGSQLKGASGKAVDKAEVPAVKPGKTAKVSPEFALTT
jgi:hypothetical protein